MLIQIHGQHAHQQLLEPRYQKQLLDIYAHEPTLLKSMKSAYQTWHQSCQTLAAFQQLSLEREARQQLVDYHLKELNEFQPVQGEYPELDQEYKRLSNCGQFLTLSQNSLQLLSDNEEQNILSMLNVAKHEITELTSMESQFNSLLEMLEEASIQISEVSDELRHYSDRLEMDPNRLFEVEKRMSKYISLSRKHRVAPEELYDLHQQLMEEKMPYYAKMMTVKL